VPEPFPAAVVPDHPVLSARTMASEDLAALPSFLDAGPTTHVISGRMALALALRDLGWPAGTKILVPAYHCTAMIEPVVWAKFEPVFYRVHEDTSVDLDDVARKLDENTRALIAVHYFGFHQDAPALRRFCDERGLVFIEDCAHAFFGRLAGKPVGAYGHVSIASSWKFFPIQEGGCLIRRGHAEISQPGLVYQAKTALNTLERAWRFGRLPWLRAAFQLPMRLKEALWGRWKRQRAASGAGAVVQEAPRGSPEFDASWVGKTIPVASRLVLRAAAHSRVVTRRRRLYRRLIAGIEGVPGVRPLFPTLLDGVVPYVVPLLFDEPEDAFERLKRRGVPIVRFAEFLWEGVDASVCPVAVDYSRRVLQFPCHQELRVSELNWIVREIRRVLAPAAAVRTA